MARSYADLLKGVQWNRDQANKQAVAQQQLLDKAAVPFDDTPKLITTVEQPEVVDFAKSQLAALPGQAQESRTAFDKFRQDFEDQQAQARASAPTAYDTSGSRQAVADFESEQKRLIGQRRGETADYAQKVEAMARQALDYGARGIKGGQLVSPTATGDSGALRGRRARLYSETVLPFQRELYGLESGITGQEQGLERDYLANAQYLQNLGFQARSMSQEEAFRYLAFQNEIPMISQRLRAGEISIAQALAALERSGTDYTYTQPYDPSRIPPITTGSYNSGGGVRSYRDPGEPIQSPPYVPRLSGSASGQGQNWYESRGLPNPADPGGWYLSRGLPVPPRLKVTQPPPFDWSDESTTIPRALMSQ